jgi:hypothetical protein
MIYHEMGKTFLIGVDSEIETAKCMIGRPRKKTPDWLEGKRG